MSYTFVSDGFTKTKEMQIELIKKKYILIDYVEIFGT